nr:MAG TPA: hypothetical protein [Caudoviricetes sp.]
MLLIRRRYSLDTRYLIPPGLCEYLPRWDAALIGAQRKECLSPLTGDWHNNSTLFVVVNCSPPRQAEDKHRPPRHPTKPQSNCWGFSF